jgi:hypothetical protein
MSAAVCSVAPAAASVTTSVVAAHSAARDVETSFSMQPVTCFTQLKLFQPNRYSISLFTSQKHAVRFNF